MAHKPSAVAATLTYNRRIRERRIALSTKLAVLSNVPANVICDWAERENIGCVELHHNITTLEQAATITKALNELGS